MRQAELGKLDLDKPVSQYIDPWNAKQTPPNLPLASLYGPTINSVTTRMLLQMRSGLQDVGCFYLSCV